MSSKIAGAVAGVAYPVTSVAGRDATVLAQFLAETGFTVDVDGSTCLVKGRGSPQDGQVCFHESDDLGQDVRVWHVSQVDSGFVAEHVKTC